MSIIIQLFIIVGLFFLLTKKIKAVYSITFQEKKSKTVIIITVLIFILIIVVGFYFSDSILHYFLSLLGASIIILDPYTSGISTDTNKFIHNKRREVLFLSFPEKVDIGNINRIEITDVSADVFSITYFFNKRYNKLYFSKQERQQIFIFLESHNLLN